MPFSAAAPARGGAGAGAPRGHLYVSGPHPLPHRPHCPRRAAAAASGAAAPSAPHGAASAFPGAMLSWLHDAGLPPDQRVTVQTVARGAHTAVDLTVAACAVAPGELLLHVPERLVVTLDRVFQDSTVTDMLTTGKLSELAVLALFLMYEKKRGKDSFWYAFIKELDRQAGRGPAGARSPLLWPREQAEELLAGSPVLSEISARLRGIEREWDELDTVWYMSGSLFSQYPFEVPSEQFSLETFTQAFAAVQSCVVHLQGVPVSRRFALVPLGPPLLTYSPTAAAMLRWDAAAREVRLEADRAYAPGEPVVAWCGPQPNSRLLLNYGIVDEGNPYDRLAVVVTLPADDPLFRLKRDLLAAVRPAPRAGRPGGPPPPPPPGLSTQQRFELAAGAPLPPALLPYLALAHAGGEGEARAAAAAVAAAVGGGGGAGAGAAAAPDGPAARAGMAQLGAHLAARLGRYRTTVAEDDAVIADAGEGARRRVAARLVRSEKLILQAAAAALAAAPGAAEAAAAGPPAGTGVRLGSV